MSFEKKSVIIKRILTDKTWRRRYALATPVGKMLPDSLYLKLLYKTMTGKKLNLKNPQTFNEKLQWLKLHDRKSIYTTMADKYLAKEYVGKIIGKEHIIPTLGVWESFDDINFDSLPEQFVLKCTHDSGGLVICKDRRTFNLSEAKHKIETSLKRNYYYNGREWPYKNIKPQIIAEKYMQEGGSDELMDYKLMCFHGKVKAAFVCTGRGTNKGLHITFYTAEWNRMPFEEIHYPSEKTDIDKPKSYEEMIELAERLSENIPFVRVDFYEVNQKVFFGELTFYTGGGMEEFTPQEWEYKFGEYISLPADIGGGVILNSGYALWIHKETEISYDTEQLGLKDYKFYCFNGKPEFLYLSQGLDHHSTARISYVTLDWKKERFHRLDYKEFETLPEKPDNLDRMIEFAKLLSKDIPFVRVDFYDLHNQIYFSEMTFYPGGGHTPFEPEEYDLALGKMVELPHISVKKRNCQFRNYLKQLEAEGEDYA